MKKAFPVVGSTEGMFDGKQTSDTGSTKTFGEGRVWTDHDTDTTYESRRRCPDHVVYQHTWAVFISRVT